MINVIFYLNMDKIAVLEIERNIEILKIVPELKLENPSNNQDKIEKFLMKPYLRNRNYLHINYFYC